MMASMYSSKSLKSTEINHQSHRFKTNCCNSRCRLFSLMCEFAGKVQIFGNTCE